LAFKIANYTWIIVAIILGMLSHWVRALRWRLLIEPLGYKPKPMNVYMAVLIGYLANLALPRLGEVSRCGILTKYEKIPFNKSFGSVISERAVDMLSFIVLFLLLLITQSERLNLYIQQKIYTPLQAKLDLNYSQQSNLAWVIVGLAFVGIALFYFFRKSITSTKTYLKFNGLLGGFLAGMKSVIKMKHPVRFITYTILIWILYLLMAYVVFFSLHETSNLSLDAGLAILVFGSVGIMLVQGGIGIYPAIVAETLFLFSITSTTGYAMGWLIWSSQTIMVLIAGVFSLLLLNTFNAKGNGNTGTLTTEDTDQPDFRENTIKLENQ
jgi:uncharacterized protein (TIRG00374 family)